MVVIDATMLLLLLQPNAGVPLDSKTKEPIADFQARLAYWIEQTENSGSTIIIPAPALSEALVNAGRDGPRIVEKIREFAVFRFVAFDTLEAIEVAEMTRADRDAGDKRGGASKDATWAKIKYDRQIVAIAKVAQATTIYTDDEDLSKFGRKAGLSIVNLSELPLPPLPDQQDLPFRDGVQEASDEAVDEETALADAVLAALDELEEPGLSDAEEKTPSEDPKKQHERFKELARETGADKNAKAFEKAFEKIVPPAKAKRK